MLDEYIDFAVRLAELAAAEIRKHFRAQFEIDNKAEGGQYDPVTIADRNAEAVMRAEIQRVYPAHGILVRSTDCDKGRARSRGCSIQSMALVRSCSGNCIGERSLR